ncbi:hypothetical protein [Brevibacillus borstelensis]|uniref:hypothetical protein n=1 Tax=Brevibacillus borstelensis TaxID=45462 RepID=UPI0030C2823E
MKNLRYFPYERNLFFKGKLLTVRDFESEQRYFNDKRRLINRLIHGGGVVCGLQVVAVDEKQISVEAGVALDYLGREIVVPDPVKLKLSMMDGFSNNDYAKNVYVCLAYDEKGKEQVFSVAEAGGQEVSEYNRIAEGYTLFIREEAPHPASFERGGLTEQRVLVYQDSQLRIWQASPRYVNPGEIFELRVHVEKTVQTPRVQFQYELDAPELTVLEGEGGRICFQERVDSKQTDCVASFRLRAGLQSGAVSLGVKGGRAEVRLGDRLVQVELSTAGKLEITPEDIEERILSDYYSQKLDKITELNDYPCIYLAKVCLLQMNASYVIEKVVPVPFEEYVYTPSLLQQLGQARSKQGAAGPVTDPLRTVARTRELAAGEKPSFAITYDAESNEYLFDLGLPKQGKHGEQMATGVVEIPIEPFTSTWPFIAKVNNSFFSDEIGHGLGSGSVLISTGIEDDTPDMFVDILSQSDQIFYGNTGVFEDTEFAADAVHISVGTILYPRKGTFRIGIKLRAPVQMDFVRVRWWAMRPSSAAASKIRETAGSLEENGKRKSDVYEAAAGTDEESE